MVVGEKFVFCEAYEKVGVARSYFGSHCNTVNLFVVVVTKRTVECENQLGATILIADFVWSAISFKIMTRYTCSFLLRILAITSALWVLPN